MPINTTKPKISLNSTHETSLTCLEHELKTGVPKLVSAATGDKTEPESTLNSAPEPIGDNTMQVEFTQKQAIHTILQDQPTAAPSTTEGTEASWDRTSTNNIAVAAPNTSITDMLPGHRIRYVRH